MKFAELTKSLVVNLIGALIVTVMIWFFIATLHNEYLPFIAALCGMYVFAGFGVNNIIEGKIIPDNYSRFVLAIACIIIYVIAFLYVMPMIFGSGVFPAPLVLTSNIVLDTPIILAIFAVIVLVINYLDYR